MKCCVFALIGLAGSPAWAFNGCYNNDNEAPYEGNLDLDTASDVIDVYIDDSFYEAQLINGLPQATAYEIVRQVINAFASEGGPSFVLRFVSNVVLWDCDEPTFNDNPFIVIAAVQDTGVSCGAGELACAEGYEDSTPIDADLACGWVKFDIGNENPLNPGAFRAVLYHEIGHVLGWGHVDELNDCPASFADDASIMTAAHAGNTFLALPAAEKKVLQTDYGRPGDQAMKWRSKQHTLTAWSGETQLASNPPVLGPPGATDAPIHAHGLAYRYLPVGAPTGVRATTFDPTNGWVTDTPTTGWATFHKPDIALAANRPGGAPDTWGLFTLTGDTPEDANLTLRLYEKPLSGGAWTLRTSIAIGGKHPFLSCAYDPRSDRFICLTRRDDGGGYSGQLRFLHRVPGQAGGSWNSTTVAQDLPRPFGTGADIACSPLGHPPADVFNCIAVGLERAPVAPSTATHVVYRLFYFNSPTIVVDAPTTTFFPSRWSPQVSAHPDGSSPWFVVAFQSNGSAWNTLNFIGIERDLDVDWFQNSLPPTGSAVLSWMPGLGAHKYGATAYQDLSYGKE